MVTSAPSLEEYTKNPTKYLDFDMIMDNAGKFIEVTKAEARRRQHLQ